MSRHPMPGGAQIPQLALQQTVPGEQKPVPHGTEAPTSGAPRAASWLPMVMTVVQPRALANASAMHA